MAWRGSEAILWVKVRVFGEFPPASLNALIGPDEVSAAMKRS
jgi:hypothetical protein